MRAARGFTLVEAVITIVILAVVAGVLAPFIVEATRGFTDTRERAELVAKGRLALERLARDLRQADPGTVAVGGGGSSLNYTRVGVNFGAPDPDIDVDFAGPTPHKVYRSCRPVAVGLAGSRIDWDEGADGSVEGVLVDGVTNLAFATRGGDTDRPVIVRVELQLTEGGSSVDLQRQVQVRNTQGDACP